MTIEARNSMTGTPLARSTLAGFRTALEMGRERRCAAGQSAQIDDAPHACARGRASEVVGGVDDRRLRSPIGRPSSAPGSRRSARRRARGRATLRRGSRPRRLQWSDQSRTRRCRMPREAPHRAAALFESSKKTAADVSRRSGEQNGAHRRSPTCLSAS